MGNHSVCLWSISQGQGPTVAGRVTYYPLPKVRFIDKLVSMGVRTFLNPGWHRHVQVSCENCSAANRISAADGSQPFCLPLEHCSRLSLPLFLLPKLQKCLRPRLISLAPLGPLL